MTTPIVLDVDTVNTNKVLDAAGAPDVPVAAGARRPLIERAGPERPPGVDGLGLRSHDYVGLIGDAGALVYLTNPELFQAQELPVRVNLSGIGRGQTIVNRRPAAQDQAAWADDPWPRIEVVLDDLPAAADRFVATIDRTGIDQWAPCSAWSLAT